MPLPFSDTGSLQPTVILTYTIPVRAVTLTVKPPYAVALTGIFYHPLGDLCASPLLFRRVPPQANEQAWTVCEAPFMGTPMRLVIALGWCLIGDPHKVEISHLP